MCDMKENVCLLGWLIFVRFVYNSTMNEVLYNHVIY